MALAVLEKPDASLHYSWIRVNRGQATYSLEITEDMVPRIPVSFLLMRPRISVPKKMPEGAIIDPGKPETIANTTWLTVKPVANRVLIKLDHEKVITPLPKKGISRGRARLLHKKKKKGLRRGSGSKSGGIHAKISRKEVWMSKIRALRKRLRELKINKIISQTSYRQLYIMAKSGRFESVADMERYLKTRKLWRKR